MTFVTTIPASALRGKASRGAAYDAAPRSLMATLRLWRRRAEERAQLARFSVRELQDIGLSPTDAQREIDKPAWRA